MLLLQFEGKPRSGNRRAKQTDRHSAGDRPQDRAPLRRARVRSARSRSHLRQVMKLLDPPSGCRLLEGDAAQLPELERLRALVVEAYGEQSSATRSSSVEELRESTEAMLERARVRLRSTTGSSSTANSKPASARSSGSALGSARACRPMTWRSASRPDPAMSPRSR